MEWVPRNPRDNFFSTPDGRFDLFYAPLDLYWVAIDSDLGKVFRGTHAKAIEWCEYQSKEPL
jgi:hypothetical protein